MVTYINYYLSKYIGQYEVRADIDKRTNDYCRDKHGNLCDDSDIYINCNRGIKIFHYGKNVLEVYVPSVKVGNSITAKISEKLQLEKSADKGRLIFTNSNKEAIIYDLISYDSEVLFKVKDKNLTDIIEFLQPKTKGKNLSPFSPKNLKRKSSEKYQFSKDEIEEYKRITSEIKEGDKLLIHRINKTFLNDVICNKSKPKLELAKQDMKKEQLQLREYIYKIGRKSDYLNYLSKEIKKYYGTSC